jgi:hypothetical protein
MEETKPVGGVGAARNVLKCQLILPHWLRAKWSLLDDRTDDFWIVDCETGNDPSDGFIIVF